jgi:hypothetical protein
LVWRLGHRAASVPVSSPSLSSSTARFRISGCRRQTSPSRRSAFVLRGETSAAWWKAAAWQHGDPEAECIGRRVHHPDQRRRQTVATGSQPVAHGRHARIGGHGPSPRSQRRSNRTGGGGGWHPIGRPRCPQLTIRSRREDRYPSWDAKHAFGRRPTHRCASVTQPSPRSHARLALGGCQPARQCVGPRHRGAAFFRARLAREQTGGGSRFGPLGPKPGLLAARPVGVASLSGSFFVQPAGAVGLSRRQRGTQHQRPQRLPRLFQPGFIQPRQRGRIQRRRPGWRWRLWRWRCPRRPALSHAASSKLKGNPTSKAPNPACPDGSDRHGVWAVEL